MYIEIYKQVYQQPSYHSTSFTYFGIEIVCEMCEDITINN